MYMLYVLVCACIYVYVLARVDDRRRVSNCTICVCTYVYVLVCVCTYVYVLVCVCTYVYVYILYVSVRAVSESLQVVFKFKYFTGQWSLELQFDYLCFCLDNGSHCVADGVEL